MSGYLIDTNVVSELTKASPARPWRMGSRSLQTPRGIAPGKRTHLHDERLPLNVAITV